MLPPWSLRSPSSPPRRPSSIATRPCESEAVGCRAAPDGGDACWPAPEHAANTHATEKSNSVLIERIGKTRILTLLEKGDPVRSRYLGLSQRLIGTKVRTQRVLRAILPDLGVLGVPPLRAANVCCAHADRS